MDAVPRDPVAAALDGATRDPAVSGDAMRWSPDLLDLPARLPSAGTDDVLSGVEVAAGLGSDLGLDGPALQRLVTGALFALPRPPGRRELTAGPAPEDEE